MMSNDLLDPAKEMARRWGTVFTDPSILTQAAKDLGYTIAPMTCATRPALFGVPVTAVGFLAMVGPFALSFA